MAAPPPEPHIPLAYLPRLADAASLSSMSFGSAGLLLLLSLDVWRSETKNTLWIRGDSLVQGALSLQLLGLLYRPVVSISDAEGLNQQVVNLLFERIHNNQLLILGERVVTCVFIGILLPGVARSCRRNLWSDIFSVAIIATVRLIHISYETYIVVIKNSIDHQGFCWNYWRWITAVVYYPRRMDKKGSGLMAYFHVEDFWKRAMLELQEKFIQWDINSILNRNLFIFVHKLRLYKLLPAFLYLQFLLVLISKTCWLISEMIFSNRYMRSLLMGRASHELSVLYNLYSNRQVGGPAIPKEFVKYLEDSMQMPGENPAGGWIANRKPIRNMKARLKEGKSDGKNCKALICFLEKRTSQDLRFADPFGNSFPKLLVERDFNVGKSSAKLTAVSLLAIIIELSGFYDAYDRSPATDDCIKACWEAWEIMELVENSDTEAAFVNKQADRLFHRLKESRRWLGIALPISSYNSEDRSVEAVKLALQCLAEKAEQMANRGCICSTGYDSKNWEEIIGGSSLYNLCETIKMRSDNINEILNFVQNSLPDIIGSCVCKVEKIIMEECRIWAETFMDEELWEAFYVAGKARGVSRQLPLEFTYLQL